MKKKIILALLTASMLASSIAPVYGAEFTSEAAEAAFSAGEKENFTEEKAPEIFTEKAVDPAQEDSEMESAGENIWKATKTLEGDYYQETTIKFTPQRSCFYNVTAVCSDEEAGAEGELDLLDEESENSKWMYGESCYRMVKGRTYEFEYSTESEKTGLTVDFTIEQQAYVTKMEWVEEPSDIYAIVDVSRWEDLLDENLIYTAGMFEDGKIKVSYSDGTSDIIELWDYTRYQQRIINEIKYAGKEAPKPGTYTVEFSLGRGDVKFDAEDDCNALVTEVKILDPDTLPTIHGTGTITVPMTRNKCRARLVTGKETQYRFSTNHTNLSLFSYEKGRENTEGAKFLIQGESVTLKPNTVYYLTSSGKHPVFYDTLTISVSTGKTDISKCKVTVPAAAYTGKGVQPKIVVKDGTKTLKLGKDYTVTYKNNKNMGTGTVTVKGKGSYTGTATQTFHIQPKKPSISSAKRSSSTTAKITWKKVTGAGSYIVLRAVGGKWTKIATVKATSYTDKNLKKGTTYQYKIRAAAKAGKKNIYSADSAAKTVK